MTRDWTCLGIALAVPVLLGLSALLFTLWQRALRRLARAEEVIGALSAPFVHPNSKDPFDG